jgi:hypothetical protein
LGYFTLDDLRSARGSLTINGKTIKGAVCVERDKHFRPTKLGECPEFHARHW